MAELVFVTVFNTRV